MEIETKSDLSLALSTAIKIINEFGYTLSPESVILDFGCGSGRMVHEFCSLGYKAFGCGTRFNTDEKVDTEAMTKEGILRTIKFEHYKLPFMDNSFDFIYSFSVFEHVQNYSESIAEIARILKPDGYCLHFFASRWRPIEPHIYVPFASIIQSRWWLYLWARLGIRNEWTKGLKAKETSVLFHNYLKEETNYLSRRQLKLHFTQQFEDVIFCEDLLLKHSAQKGKYIYALSRVFHFIPAMYSTFRIRVILTRKPNNTLNRSFGSS